MGQLIEVARDLVHGTIGLHRQVRGGPALLSADEWYESTREVMEITACKEGGKVCEEELQTR